MWINVIVNIGSTALRLCREGHHVGVERYLWYHTGLDVAANIVGGVRAEVVYHTFDIRRMTATDDDMFVINGRCVVGGTVAQAILFDIRFGVKLERQRSIMRGAVNQVELVE